MYRLRPRARQDIKQIYKTSKKDFGTIQADKYYRELFAAFRKLDERFDLGTDYSAVRQNIRGYRMKSHVIFYQRHDRTDIDVIRILHKRMDYKRHL